MATSSNRDVRLTVEAQTQGEEAIKRLASEVRTLGKDGKDAAPAFQQLASELDSLAGQSKAVETLKRLLTELDATTAAQRDTLLVASEAGKALEAQATQTTKLRDAQQAAAGNLADAKREQAALTDELARYKLTADASVRGTAEYAAEITRLKVAKLDARKAVLELGDAYSVAKREADAAAKVERDLARDLGAASKAVAGTEQALRQRNDALREAEQVARAAGVETKDLAAAEERLAAAVSEVASKASGVRAAAMREQAEADRLAAVEALGLAELRQRGVIALNAEAAAQKEAAQVVREYAAAKALEAAEAAKAAKAREQSQSDRLAILESQAESELRQRGAAALQAELAAQRDAVRVAEQYAEQQQRQLQLAKQLEQAEADRSARVRERALYEQQRSGEAQAASELAAIRESEAFTRRYTQAQQELAAAAARTKAELQEAFGAAGVRSLSTITAEIDRTAAALRTLEAAAARGTISQQDLQRAVGGGQARMQALRDELNKMPGATSALERMGDTVTSLVNRYGALSAAAATAVLAVKPIVDMAAQLDSLRRVLTTVGGSSAEASRQIELLRSVAQESGQAFTGIADSYVKFATSAKLAGVSTDVVDRTFRSTALAAGNLGLSSDRVTRVLEALSQMASKGTVSMEELRQQLGDSLPGALSLMAKGLGIAERDLNKLVESGGLLATDALPALATALVELGPKGGGAVEGITASFNRLKNVISETATTITDGAFGKAAGIAFEGLSFAVERLAFGAALVGESFTVAGKQIGTVLGAVVSGDFKNLSDALAQIEQESTTKLANLAARIGGVGTAASGATPGVQQASTAVQAAGQAAATAAPALQTVASAHTAAGAAASAAAPAHTAAATAVASAGEAATGAAKSWVQISIEYAKSLDKAKAAADVSKSLAEAKKTEGEASVAAARIAGDEVVVKQAATRASEEHAAALRALAEADTAVSNVLRDQLAALEAVAKAEGRNDQATKEKIEDLRKQVAAKAADAEKTREQAAAADVQAASNRVASESIKDNTARQGELRTAVKAAAEEVERARLGMVDGTVTSDQFRNATVKLAAAQGLLRDATADAAASAKYAIDLRTVLTKAEVEGLRVGTEASKAREKAANTAADYARAKGDEVEAIRQESKVLDEQITQRKIEQQTVELEAKTIRDNAQARIASIREQRAELESRGALTPEKARELQLEQLEQQALLKTADARAANAAGIKAEVAALQRKRTEQTLSSGYEAGAQGGFGGIGSTKAPNTLGTTPTLSGRTAASDFSIATKAGTIGSTYTPPPDNTGDWEWITDAAHPGGFWRLSATGGARRTKVQVEQQQVLQQAYARAGLDMPAGMAGGTFMNLPRSVLDQVTIDRATGTYSLRDQAPVDVTAPAVAPSAPAAAGVQRYEVKIDLSGGQSTTINVGSAEQASALVALLQQLQTEMLRVSKP
jgi:tape measure domain-containing protein